MEATRRRLYVGGISPSVTDAELSERFGRFGKVDAVDIISRKDEQGNPLKTFAYMNIHISDADFKKCLSVLNKTKWKGGVLQIEVAKESFLHKLEQERQAVKDQKKPKEQKQTDGDLLQSLEKSGITDFQMKAAVPGTEVPNHKNWVVSKYGRVLPVLHLKGNTPNKIMKYDPSKYCHNIKKLDNPSLEPTPVSQLTWYLDGGEDDISKKRRGEFPEFKSSVKKSKVNPYLNTSKTDVKGSSIRTPQTSLQKATNAFQSQQKKEYFQDKSRGRKSINSMLDEEYDSEEELKAIIEREKMMKQSESHIEDSNLEVVDDSFTPSYQTHWAEVMGQHRRSNASSKDDNGYDSADTDEIITVAKTSQNCNNGKKEKFTALAKHSNVISTDLSISKSSVKCEDEEDSRTEEDSHGNDSDTQGSSDSYSDEEYESMMQNCYRLDLSMGDLKALVDEAAESDNSDENDSDQEYDSEDADIGIADAKCVQHDTASDLKRSEGNQTPRKKQISKDLDPGHCSSALSSDRSISHIEGEGGSVKQGLGQVDLKFRNLKSLEIPDSKSSSDDDDQTQKKPKSSDDNTAAIRNLKRKKCIEPEDIVASILEDDDSSNERSKRKKKKSPPTKPPAFKGLGSLMSSLSVSKETKAPGSSSAPPKTGVTVGSETKASPTSGESKRKQEPKANGERPIKKTSTDVHRRDETDSGSSSSSSGESSSDTDSSSSTFPVAKANVSQKSGSKEQTNSKAKQFQDNQKRLAAMEERRKEREQQKRAIQGALLKLDSQSAKKSHHIVFNSESEEESEKEEEASTSNVHSGKTNPGKAKLFESSGEDSDDEEEKDDKRFEIKAQYEGRSGEKLMQLQSRFVTDERFKMDARFLEDSSEGEEDTEQSQKLQANDDDDGLSAEKKKNLDILQSVLNINVEPQATSKKAAKAKTFKDLNALQYDPTKEDHTVFETKVTEEKKESKSERKKQQLEAEKLPEVSQETFHEVLVDFKEVFGAPRPQAMEEPETTWDQAEEPQKMEVEDSISDMDFGFQKSEEPAGFTFSFFGTSTEESVSQDEPYKIETIKTAKVAWQEDPRFQDSSSEEEEEDAAVTVNTSSLSEKSSSIRFFFFVKDDTRLKEGPKMFFRSSKSEEKAKYWDDMRDTVMEECKKRHRDAKRKLKSKY
ncbi:nucleolar protein 8 [Bufo bufo]|uniref:nucleolar protein 8 n=1 Tax=Bufo bufo TaxID=8384 RepID=UPI001ABE6F3C|nr:nucleolar protein 8 [Bufo bufo]XP_040262967.1 nucleolar protein 8 [Bufo bufo]